MVEIIWKNKPERKERKRAKENEKETQLPSEEYPYPSSSVSASCGGYKLSVQRPTCLRGGYHHWAQSKSEFLKFTQESCIFSFLLNVILALMSHC